MSYDEPELLRKLNALPGSGCGVFAASCAERLVSLVLEYPPSDAPDDLELLRVALDGLWEVFVTREPEVELKLTELAEGLDDLVVEDEEADARPFSQNAIAACIYALQSRLDGGNRNQAAVWAARQVIEALDFFVVNRDDIDLNAADAETTVMADPLLQLELWRQQACISHLMSEGDGPSVVRECRAIASSRNPLSPCNYSGGG